MMFFLPLTGKEGAKEKEKPAKQEKKKPAKPKKPKAQSETSTPVAVATAAAAAPKGEYFLFLKQTEASWSIIVKLNFICILTCKSNALHKIRQLPSFHTLTMSCMPKDCSKKWPLKENFRGPLWPSSKILWLKHYISCVNKGNLPTYCTYDLLNCCFKIILQLCSE